MTNHIFSDEVHKECDSDDLENILRSLVDENGNCMICGHDHSFTGKEKILGLVETLRKHGRSNCIPLLRDIVRIHSSTKIVHESYTHPTLTESRLERRPSRPRLSGREGRQIN